MFEKTYVCREDANDTLNVAAFDGDNEVTVSAAHTPAFLDDPRIHAYVILSPKRARKLALDILRAADTAENDSE